MILTQRSPELPADKGKDDRGWEPCGDDDAERWGFMMGVETYEHALAWTTGNKTNAFIVSVSLSSGVFSTRVSCGLLPHELYPDWGLAILR